MEKINLLGDEMALVSKGADNIEVKAGQLETFAGKSLSEARFLFVSINEKIQNAVKDAEAIK